MINYLIFQMVISYIVVVMGWMYRGKRVEWLITDT
jgi:hypothetical protein